LELHLCAHRVTKARVRVATLGIALGHPVAVQVPAFSDTTLLDFEAVIIDADGVIEELTSQIASYQENGVVSTAESHMLTFYLRKRKKQLDEFLELGRPLIAFCSTVHTIPTGSNVDPKIDVGSYLPGTGRNFYTSAGENIVFEGPQPYKAFADRVTGVLRFRAIMDPSPGTPLFYLKGTKKVLGAIITEPKRWILLSPHLKPNPEVISPGQHSHGHRFVEAALALFKDRPVAGTDFVPPAWQGAVVLSSERPLLDRRDAERKALLEAEQALLETEKALKAIDESKRAFTSKGDVLMDTVAGLLRMLGLVVEPGPEVKDDLIAKGYGLIFVVEVKGRDKTGAAEKDARQLESWVSRYAHEHDSEAEPKGLLVINGYKDLPPQERKEPTFPHAMLDYVQRKNQCAITGMQLLCLALEAQEKGNQAAIAQELASTVGIFPRYGGNDWKGRIEVTPGR
jgi:hypothetical protein